MEKHTIIFDFDGTIADTLDTVIDIYNSIAPLFFCTRVDKKDKALLQTKSLQDFFRLYGVGRFKLPLVLLCIRIQLHRQLHRIHPIEGIVEALHAIKSAGFRLGIVTSNSEQNVREFLQTHVLSGVFDFVYWEKNIFLLMR